ncbi:hypothetical protein I5R52_20480 [Pseudomonas aeruginosa]|nr:hypothetical protein [Pseudomonas aeruginosa]MBH4462951.1 hypothetical protein [Pseudomonas aeruginosa]
MHIKKDVIEVIKYAAMMAACSRQSWGIYPMNHGLQGNALPWRLSPRRRSLPPLTEQE